MSIKQSLLPACLVALLGAEAAAQPPGAGAPEQADCPQFVRGSTLSTTEIDGGVQFTITTTMAGHVQRLRAMIHHAAGYLESGEPAASSARSAEQMPQARPAPLEITVSDVSGGASVKVTARHQVEVRTLRAQAKQLEQLWSSDECINGGLMRT